MSEESSELNQRVRRPVDISGQEWGSDHVADFLAAYGFEFVTFTPGSSFRGIEESLVNYRDNDPRIIETPHEALSVSIAHGYAKATGDPAVCILHDVVGTLHGTMNIFNAYCDRVPLLALAGAGPMRKSKRRPYFDWIHTALVQGNLVRGFTKWDDQPAHIEDLDESLLRALRIARTPPKGPTYVSIDHDIQEDPLKEPRDVPDFEKFCPPTKMAPDRAALERAADSLVNASMPVLLADLVGDSETATDSLVELAEVLGAPVMHPFRVGTPHRYNFPNTHPLDLSGTEVFRQADVVLALGVRSLNYLLMETDPATHEMTEAIDGEFELIDIGVHELETSALVGNEFGLRETENAIMASPELALPELVDAVTRRVQERSDGSAYEERRQSLVQLHADQRAEWQQEAEDAWDESPISLPRVVGELWEVIRDEEWVLVNGTFRGWAYKLWDIDEYDQYIGGYSGGGGIGYGVGHAIGGALAYESTDRIPINLQPDGDLMFYPGGLWTMSRYELPIFTVMHNNRSLYNSTQHRMRLAEYRGRDASFEKALVGTGLEKPATDFASMAESMGVTGYGPIEDPDDLGPTLREAWNDVKRGNPVLVDVVCQPR